MLLLGSEDDELVTPADLRAIAREAGAEGVASRVVIVRGSHGHLSVLEDAALVGPAIAQQLARLAP